MYLHGILKSLDQASRNGKVLILFISKLIGSFLQQLACIVIAASIIAKDKLWVRDAERWYSSRMWHKSFIGRMLDCRKMVWIFTVDRRLELEILLSFVLQLVAQAGKMKQEDSTYLLYEILLSCPRFNRS